MSFIGDDEYKYCQKGSLAWASLVVAFISVNVTWWLFETSKLKHGFKIYFRAIAWQAMRANFLPRLAYTLSTPLKICRQWRGCTTMVSKSTVRATR